MAVSTGLPPTAEKRISSPEAVRARAAGHEAAGGAAGAEPGRKVGFGAEAVFALPPRQPIGQTEHLAIGETAGL